MLHLPTRNDPIARLALLAIFGLALLVNLQRLDRPVADAKQEVFLAATATLQLAPEPTIAPAPIDPAPYAPVTSQEAPQATEAPPPDTQPAEIVSAPPVAPEVPIAIDVAPVVEAAPIVIAPEELTAPTQPPPAPEEDQHGSKAAPDRAKHYADATAPDDNAPEQQHGATLDPASAARWCAAAAGAGVAHCIEGDAP